MKGLNTLYRNVSEKQRRLADSTSLAFLKCFLAVWVLFCDSLSLLLSGYAMDVPVLKYIFTVLESIDGWGMEKIFAALGLGLAFYKVRDMQRNRPLSMLCAFFALCTVVGVSYSKTASWDCIFLFGTQFVLAFVVWAGYYFAYKNGILFVIYLLEKNKGFLHRNAESSLGRVIFERHAFWGSFVLFAAIGAVWMIAFFPGTLQPDAYMQLLMKQGVFEYTGHFPVASTEIMGFCMNIGKNIFHSDEMGVFTFTFVQYAVQCLVFSYSLLLMKRLKTPIVLRVAAVFFYGVSPVFPIWGFTFVKDSFYYICFLLMICAMVDLLSGEGEFHGTKHREEYKTVLLATACVGMCLFRNDGKYVVVLSLIIAVFFTKKYWKNFLIGIAACGLTALLTEGVYMSVNRIPSGPVGEMLSIPLQQTARYIAEYPDDITQEEALVLQKGFSVELSELASLYNPILSDPVKAQLVHDPEPGYLWQYFKVWMRQLVRHPDAYIQAFLNQTYAYFYPNAHDGKGEEFWFYIVYGNELHDGTFDIEFGVKNDGLRQILMHYSYLFETLPIFGMLLSPGLYTYLLIGGAVYLISKKRGKEFVCFVPAFVVLLINLVSPVNGCVRYMLPIMAAAPLLAAWCCSDRQR